MSKFSGFYRRSIEERQQLVREYTSVAQSLEQLSLDRQVGNQLIENYVGNYHMPLGMAVNIVINQKEYVIPMAIEEPSVLAAMSHGGKILGNIEATTSQRYLVGHVILLANIDFALAQEIIEEHRDALIHYLKEQSSSMVKRGGGPLDLWIKEFENDEQRFFSVYLSINPCDAMGANNMNTLLELLAPKLSELFHSEVLMAILSNYQEEHLTTAQVRVAASRLANDSMDGTKIAQRIAFASQYADLDPYRAATHNKGVMNGIDALMIATGNDWRAIEAAVHTYAAKTGHYRGITRWRYDEVTDELCGEIHIPLSVGTVGGTLSSHPQAKWALSVMDIQSASELANVTASVGLIQNFSALRALVSEGIQQGHMKMQARATAMQAGASEDEISEVVNVLSKGKIINQTEAKKIIKEIRLNKGDNNESRNR